LKLKRPNHIRAFFSNEDKWKGSYLVPWNLRISI
jgi:hypothetical protein